MPRLRRTDFPGAWHHVMNRGAANAAVFQDDVDRCRFLDSLADASDRGSFACHAYCLMDNHFHLLIQSLAGDLSIGMQWLTARYTGLQSPSWPRWASDPGAVPIGADRG